MASNPRAWQNQWQLDRARGRRRMVAIDVARAHIQWLVAQGFNCTIIAAAAGVDNGTVLKLHAGTPTCVKLAIQNKLLAVTPKDIYAGKGIGPKAYVPAIGAVRRLQALMTMGWRYSDLSPRLGFYADKVGKTGDLISQSHHAAIARLYDELWDKRGPADKGSITKAINRGWHKPMAWDDDTIDDPNAEPFGTVREGRAA